MRCQKRLPPLAILQEDHMQQNKGLRHCVLISFPFLVAFHSCMQFVDDDNKGYLEINYTFGIQKEWVE
ncbi:hypothetical protein RHSIM_Rhsim06G0225000 [Rhododendron simsii]|uniref:Uncharacterized protein n=1 Tax=Rhododendron simsii TaxID=118357 RepID=A0A834GQ86_RHOSS|nr:hypothetical protein RHSIM_Rhsim06G0225000 [Rhododendron simsii]